MIKAAFSGEHEAAEKMIALNAGAALYVADAAQALQAGVDKARDEMRSGRALENSRHWSLSVRVRPMKIPSVLEKIVATKIDEVEQRKSARPIIDLADRLDAPRGFKRALVDSVERGKSAVIAEIKKASPSKGDSTEF